MKINKCKCVFFSPTGTTRRIVNYIADSVAVKEKEIIDFTKLAVRNQNQITFTNNELAIIGVPVYSGRIPKLAEDFIKGLKVKGTLVVVVVVYGNREYGDSLIELKNICVKVGFRPFAGGAFIGEHAMTSKKKSVAFGRPDEEDYKIAKDLGAKISNKIEHHNMNFIDELSVPGNCKLKKRVWMPKVSPKTNVNLCRQCLKCIEICPVGAIRKEGRFIKTDKSKCIACYGCIKTCPQKAREMKNLLFKLVTEVLYRTCQERKEPEIYI